MPRFLKASPWMLAAEAAMAARRHWKGLTPEEQLRLRALIPKARRGPSGLSAAEKQEFKDLLRRLDVPGIGVELLPVVGKRYRRRHG